MYHSHTITTIAIVCLFLCPTGLQAEPTAPAITPAQALAAMPIQEITVFKDGHAFVLHEGTLPTNARGEVVMDHLPTPVLGTFWPFSSNPDVRLAGVTAGRRSVSVRRTALNVRELLEANPGQSVRITETGGAVYPATIISLPARDTVELRETSPPNTADRLPEKGDTVLLRTAEGIKALPVSRIVDVTFPDEPELRVAQEEFRNLLTLKLNWPGGEPAKTADVGMMYLQKGIRWIPHYKIALDGDGQAVVTLHATLINELADLDDVMANLVIGVPSFAFKDDIDPIALQQNLAELSPYFPLNTQSRRVFSNSIMSQSAEMRYNTAGHGGSVNLGPEIGEGTTHEDLFVFAVEHLTLKRGERMVLPIAEYTLNYKDVYTLDVGFAPPPEVASNSNSDRQRELARLLAMPKVSHRIRLGNSSAHPLTTAPALILRDGQVLSQTMMTYTSAGASTDLEVTVAVDIQVEKTESETGRVADAVTWSHDKYTRVDLAGTIRLTNHRKTAVDLEVTRQVLGQIEAANREGTIRQLSLFEDEDAIRPIAYPLWWSWYGWPSWWSHINGRGEIAWKLRLDGGDNTELTYQWHYFWR